MTQLINLLTLIGSYTVMWFVYRIGRQFLEKHAASKRRKQTARDAVMRKAAEEWFSKEFPSA